MQTLYSIGIFVYMLLIRIAAICSNNKAQLWVNGRKFGLKKIQDDFKKFNDVERSKLIWIHAASVGEFEQARPLMEYLKLKDIHCQILLTFFSPSGYEIHKNYDLATYVYYLPVDSMRNAKRFISITQPAIAVFVKYEFWYNYISVLSSSNIPFCYISAKFRKNQIFFKPYGKWFLNKIKLASGFFVQDEKSEKLLKNKGITKVWKVGDTRFDRVLKISKEAQIIPIFEDFCKGYKVVVAGSTWSKDEDVLLNSMAKFPSLKYIIVPHEINSSHIEKLQEKFIKYNVVTFSQIHDNYSPQLISQSHIMIVDVMGMLSKLYKYAHIAYVGGGFGAGIHNILEACVYGVPVFFGPNYKKFKEAEDLLRIKGAYCIHNEKELCEHIDLFFEDWKICQYAGELAKSYVYNGEGAIERIMTEWKKQGWI